MIPNCEELLLSLLKNEEGHCVEFKSNNADGERIGKYLSALSNMALLDGRDFGYLVFGVMDKTHDLCGTDLDLTKDKQGNITLEFWLDSLLTPKGIFDFSSCLINDKRVLVIRVKKASGSLTMFRGEEYGRINESLVPLSSHVELKKQLWEKILFSVHEDDVALSAIPMDELEIYLNVRGYYSLLKQPYPSNLEEVTRRLLGEGFIKRRDDSRFDITVLGALCIATSFSYFPSLSSKYVEVVRYESDSRVSATSIPERFDSGYLFSFESIIESTLRLMGAKEVVERGIRMKQEPIPALVIRELLGNALIHQDIGPQSGKIMVECFPSRLEIWNPGYLSIDADRVIDMAPRPENRHLVEVLSRYGIGEGHGTGFDKIVQATEERILPPPLIKKEEYGVRVTVYTSRLWKDYTNEEKIRAVYFHTVLTYLEGRKATNESLRIRFGLPTTNKAQISRLLKECVGLGKIKCPSEGVGARSIYYLPYWA